MNLREKLALAFLPLVAGLILVGGLASRELAALGARTEQVFEDNFRSVLAAQRLKEYAERLDSAALIAVAGNPDRAHAQIAEFRGALEQELRVQEGNLTEPGEGEITRELRADWERFDGLLRHLEAPEARTPAFYFEQLEPAFLAVKHAADRILVLNQDAMVLKNREVEAEANRTRRIVLFVAIASTLLGAWASYVLLRRVLRPLGALGAAVERVAAGDLQARASVGGHDEIGRLGRQFDAMAAHLEEYRRSSLGDLLQAQAAAQSAIDSLPDPVLVFGVGGGLLGANRGAASLGVSLEGPGDPLAPAEPDIRTLLERVRAHVLQGKGAYVPKGFEDAVRVVGPEADRWFLPRATPLHAEEGRVAGATVVLQDVTRLHRFDELKNDLVSTVAHEFRTPLTSLRMAIHFLAEEAVGPLTAKQAEFLGAAREDCERLQGIVDDLLDLARVQSGRLELSPEPVTPAELLEAAARRHGDAAAVRGLRLVVEPAPGATVLADRSRLDLVFDNLVENALRHTPSGGTIALRAKPLDHALRFEIEDTGSGIPAEHLRSVFDRFFRVPGTPPGGAGLGLSIVQEIVRAHGGDVGVESEVGRGSTFWFTLPLAAVAGLKPAPAYSGGVSPGPGPAEAS